MKVLSINLGNYSSTGSIAQGIKQEAKKHGIEYVLAYPFDPRNKPSGEDDWLIGNAFGRKCSIALGMITGYNGCFSLFSTLKLLRRIKRYQPDIIHFHNLHNNYVNLPILFRYVKKNHIKIVWTLHDCWSFTGQCPYFEMVGCEKWKTGCHSCQRYKEYPKAFIDNTKKMWHLKKKWFNGVENLTIVTPSAWLADLVKQSFMGEYPCQVINNGINLSVFKPTSSDWKERQGLSSKKVILGVAFDWGVRKGLDVFINLANRLSEEYQIVLVGTNEQVDKMLPTNIISIHCTQNQQELAEIYSAADIFVNPTRDEVLGLVNIEALACGTPGITFNSGGSPECYSQDCGAVVECGDVDAMEREVIRICNETPYSLDNCTKRAAMFNKDDRFKDYIDLYLKIQG